MASGKGVLTGLQHRVLRFFLDHPHAVETVRGVAGWIGDEAGTIQGAIQALLKRKWLTSDETSLVTGYALTRDERCLAQIRQVLEAG